MPWLVTKIEKSVPADKRFPWAVTGLNTEVRYPPGVPQAGLPFTWRLPQDALQNPTYVLSQDADEETERLFTALRAGVEPQQFQTHLSGVDVAMIVTALEGYEKTALPPQRLRERLMIEWADFLKTLEKTK